MPSDKERLEEMINSKDNDFNANTCNTCYIFKHTNSNVYISLSSCFDSINLFGKKNNDNR